MAIKFTLPKPLFSESGKRCVLLLHAYSGSSNDVRMLSRFLESHQYSVYSPIFTGHGTLNPMDILKQSVTTWGEDTKNALQFLKDKGYQQIAVFGLSMGGIFSTRLIEEQDENVIGGGFFCSPITPVASNVPENFIKYAKEVLKNQEETTAVINEKLEEYQVLVEKQLAEIQAVAAQSAEGLEKINVPFFMAQAGQDEMIDATGVFKTAEALKEKRFVLQWYPDSSHVITVGKARRQLEQDVLDFLSSLSWNEESHE